MVFMLRKDLSADNVIPLLPIPTNVRVIPHFQQGSKSSPQDIVTTQLRDRYAILGLFLGR